MNLKILSEDLEDMLTRIEKSFDIRFEINELAHVKTYGEFCDAIKEKIKLNHSDNCTTQQAFHKLREAMTNSLQVDKQEVTPTTSLTDIFPRNSRKAQIKRIEKKLGFNLSILRPPHFVTGFLALLLLGSFIMIFIDWKYGLVGLGVAIGGLWISNKTGNELDVATVGGLSERMTRENYVNARRDSKTINKNELDKILEDWFVDFLGVPKCKLTKDARLT